MFEFNKSQQRGILFFFTAILVLQAVYFWVSYKEHFYEKSEQELLWLSNQSWVDSLKQIEKPAYQPYPFNPNFITDFKGYQLGMSVEEIDRLHEFRKTDKYVNSTKEFQNITQVSDSLLAIISPYFKFPDWVTNPKSNNNKDFYNQKYSNTPAAIIPQDINTATQEDLIKVRGIGPALSERILRYKINFGAFVSMEQLKEVYGLSDDVIYEVNKYFKVENIAAVKKLKINELSIKELGAFPYFKYPISKNIVVYRSMNGDFKNSDDLLNVTDFPIEKIKIIGLYLEF